MRLYPFPGDDGTCSIVPSNSRLSPQIESQGTIPSDPSSVLKMGLQGAKTLAWVQGCALVIPSPPQLATAGGKNTNVNISLLNWY